MSRSHPVSRLLRWPSLLVLVLAATGLSCQTAGFIAQAVSGPEKVPAKYVPDKTRPLVVVAENWRDPSSAVDAEQVARFVSDELRERQVAPVIDPVKVASLAASRPADWRKMSIPAVGRAVGAGQIVYVNLVSNATERNAGSTLISGSGTAMVRVVDADTGATLWPIDAEAGYPVGFETPMMHDDREDVSPESVRFAVQRGLSAKIAKLFYDFQPQ